MEIEMEIEMDSEMDSETDRRPASAHPPIACTLTDKQARKQTLEWVDLQQRASGVTSIEGGVRMTLPAALAGDVVDLAQREAGCCSFLTIETSIADDVLTLEISSADPAAFPVISALAGIPVR